MSNEDPHVEPPSTLENIVVMAIWGAFGLLVTLVLAGAYWTIHTILHLLAFIPA